jgi:hypothetical protein
MAVPEREKLFVGLRLVNDFQSAQAASVFSRAPIYRLLNSVTGFFLAAGAFFSGMVSSMTIFFTP